MQCLRVGLISESNRLIRAASIGAIVGALCFVLCGKSVAIPVSDVQSRIANELASRIRAQFFNMENVDFSTQVVIPDQWVRSVARATTMDINTIDGARVAGRTVVQLELQSPYIAGSERVKVYADTSVTADYYVAARPMKKGDIVASTDLIRLRGSVTSFMPQVVGKSSLIVGKELLTPINDGGVFTTLFVRDVPDLHRGDTVWVDYRNNGIALRVSGEALSDARLGEKVRVKLKLDSHKILEGKVVDSTTVRVRASN